MLGAVMILSPAPAAESQRYQRDPADAAAVCYREAVRAGLEAASSGDLPSATDHAQDAEHLMPGRWQTAALDALVSLSSGQPNDARAMLREIGREHDDAPADAIHALLRAQDRHRAATLLMDEAAAALDAGQAYRAADRLALAGSMLLDERADGASGSDAALGEAVLAALRRQSHAGPAAANAKLLGKIERLAQARPLIADELRATAPTSSSPAQRVAERLWADALALRDAGDEAAAWDTIDLLLRLDADHAKARALVTNHWQPASPFARSLTELIERMRRTPDDQTTDEAMLLIDPAGKERPVTFEAGTADRRQASASILLGRFDHEAGAEQALAGFRALCEAALPPGWRWEAEAGHAPRATAPDARVGLELHLVSVTYDRAAAPVQASVVLEISHLAPRDAAVADLRRP